MVGRSGILDCSLLGSMLNKHKLGEQIAKGRSYCALFKNNYSIIEITDETGIVPDIVVQWYG